MVKQQRSAVVLVALLAGVVGLAGAQGAVKPQAKIVSPKRDAVITGSTVQVVLQAQGVEIAPVAEQKPGAAHFHLFLDTNLTPEDSAIPAGVPGIWHLGKGQTEYTLEVPPGAHRLIVELADNHHVPLKGAGTDTVKFTVKP